MSDLGCAMAQLGARSAEPPPDRTFCGYCAPQFGLGNCRIACGTAMIIGDVAMPYVAGWRPFDDRSGSQKRFCAGVEVHDPGMWAALLEQHLGPPCCCRTRSRRAAFHPAHSQYISDCFCAFWYPGRSRRAGPRGGRDPGAPAPRLPSVPGGFYGLLDRGVAPICLACGRNVERSTQR
jgi:hypothetical protein